MNFVAFSPFKHLDYVRRVTDVSISSDTGGIVAEDDYGVPCAVVLFDQWSVSSVVAHVTIEKPMALRKLHKEVFRYIFGDCDKQIIFGFTPANNAAARKFNEHLGFEEIGRLPDAIDIGIDVIIYRMLRSKCRYYKPFKEVA